MHDEFEPALRRYLLLFPFQAQLVLLDYLDEGIRYYGSLPNMIQYGPSGSGSPLGRSRMRPDQMLTSYLIAALRRPTPEHFK